MGACNMAQHRGISSIRRVYHEPFSRFTLGEWLAQARAHDRCAAIMYVSGHNQAHIRQKQLAREARSMARLLYVAHAFVRLGQVFRKR